MNPPEIYKVFGPISVIITGLAIAIMMYKWRGDKNMLISDNAAVNRSSYLFMLTVQSITLPMLLLFWAKWLVPTLELPSFFTILAGLACLGLLVAAWIPAAKGWKHKVHGLFAYGAAALVPPMLVMLYLSPKISLLARYMALAVFFYVLVVIAIFTVFKGRVGKYFYLQTGYIFLFALTTLVAAYT